MANVLVAGGAGYIGSHVVRYLTKLGHEVTVVDNLSTGHREFISEDSFVEADIGDGDAMRRLVDEREIDTVMHFAAHIIVPESVSNPFAYYRNNFVKTLSLLEAMVRAGAKNFIFSSTAAVYGMPDAMPVPEDEPLAPINPYGNTKAAVEVALEDFSRAYPFRYVSLRYFNAAGADPEGGIGEVHKPETHLIPLVLKAASGERGEVKIYGTDYPTPDGTCVRDYVHVNDLASAHALAMDHLLAGGNCRVYNCGYGFGYTVKEVIDTCRKVTGVDFKVVEDERRPGDPPELVADSGRIKKELGWEPSYDDLEYIVKTAWEWEQSRK